MTERVDSGGGLLAGLSNDLAGAVDKSGKYVVKVNARRRLPASGIVWSQDGVVVTADHVIEREESITVGLGDGREVAARLVGRDPGSDLAVLRAEAGGLVAAETVPAGEVKVGNLVLAVGRPGDGGPMASLGIVSAFLGTWRSWRGGVLENLIQADVTLYPGFSGGALADATGRLVGLNTSLLARGVSTAIPGEIVARVVQAILTQGKVKRGYLGISTHPVALPQGMAKGLGLSQEAGLLVVGVVPGGPAEKAGLMLGDTLVAIEGQRVQDADDLQGALRSENVGKAVSVRVVRGGKLQDVAVTVGERS